MSVDRGSTYSFLQPESVSEIEGRSGIWRFFRGRPVSWAMFLIGLSSLIGILAIYHVVRNNQQRTLVKDEVLRSCGLAHSRLQYELTALVDDILILQNLPTLKRFFDHEGKPVGIGIENLESDLMAFADGRRVYTTLEVLDLTGKVCLSIGKSETGRAVVLEEMGTRELGFRSRSFDYTKLGRNSLYISQMAPFVDTDNKSGAIKPAIQAGMVITNDRGVRCGILVMTCTVSHLFRELQHVTLLDGAQIMLVDDRGWFLRGPSADLEWGWWTERGETLTGTFPDLWLNFQEKEGSTISNNGVFHHTRLAAVDIIPDTLRPVAVNEGGDLKKVRLPSWTLVSWVPDSVMAVSRQARLINLVISAVVSSIIWLFICLSVGRYINNQTRISQQLELSRKQLSEITTSIPGGIYRAAARFSKGPTDFRFLYLSAPGEALLHAELSQLTAPGEFADRIHPEDRKRVLEQISNCFDKVGPMTVEFRVLLPGDIVNGDVLWIRNTAIVTIDHEQVLWNGALFDITELKQIEEELKLTQAELKEMVDKRSQQLADSEQRLNLAIEAAALGMWDWDISTNHVQYSDGWAKILGYRQDEIVPTLLGWERLVHPDDREIVKRFLADSFEGHDHSYQCEHRLKRKDDTYAWVLARGMVVERDGRNKPIHHAGVCIDITDRKQMEADAVTQQQHLENLVAQRTSELSIAKESLKQSEKMQLLGTLAGGVAHDFNNQLAGISGYAELLETHLDDPKLKRYADAITKSVGRAADLTHQLLAFGRQGKYMSVPIDLNGLTLEVESLLAHSIDKRIKLNHVLNGESPTAVGDPSLMQTAILNVALNARDAMPNGGDLLLKTDLVTFDMIDISPQVGDLHPGTYAVVAVGDTGIGMDAECLDKMFDPFFTTKVEGKGTGMGLAAVYGTVKDHGGAILVDSRPGKGTTVTVFLPLTRNEEVEIEPEGVLEPATGQAHILVVDDEDTLRDLVADLLHDIGYQVVTCKNGREAVEFYKQAWKSLDLVILDMVMPELSGRETFHEMKRINPKVRALLASGFSVNKDMEAALNEGIIGFIQKPFRYHELSRMIAQALTTTAHPVKTPV